MVLGTGTAASAVAHKCSAAGREVAVVDSRPFGGTCALKGCDPKKVLVGTAELIDWNNRMRSHEVISGRPQIAWPALMRFKKTFTDPIPADREKGFVEEGIATFHGSARFVDRTTVQVGDNTLSARHVVIATGARPATLNIKGEEYLTTSTQFLELEQLPKRILFVGGGYISFEFAHVAARAGAKIRILHRGSRPLERFDPDLVDQLQQATRDLSIEVLLNTPVVSIEKNGNHWVVHASVKNDIQTFEADLVVHGAGRVPDIDDLDLEKADISHDRNGIEVNEYLQSVSNPAVYAAGDAAASRGLPLTPVANLEGEVVAANLLKGNHRKADYSGVPTVVFTIPSLASVGLQEAAAKERGLKFRINHAETSGWYSSRRVGLKYSGYKVLVEEASGHILGAHLLGVDAEEVINLFALAIRKGLRAADLEEMPYAYPTSSSDISYMV